MHNTYNYLKLINNVKVKAIYAILNFKFPSYFFNFNITLYFKLL